MDENNVKAKLLLAAVAGKEDVNEVEEETLSRKLLAENKKLWAVAGPAIFTRFSTFGVSIITQAFIGHVGSTELAAYALVSTVLFRFINGILLGMSSALETLCGQAFGAKQPHMLGIYLQRSWIVLTSCAILLLPVFIFTTPILVFLGQEESISEVAGIISLWFIPVIFSFIFTFTLQMYLQSQSKNIIITYLALVSLAVHVFLSWLLVIKLSLGIAGAMSSLILAMWIPVIGQFTFVLGGWCPDTWKGFSSSAFTDLWAVVKLSISSGAMVCLELWYNSILVLLTGHIKNAEVAIDALSICININGWEMMIAVGFLAAVGIFGGKPTAKPYGMWAQTVQWKMSVTHGSSVELLVNGYRLVTPSLDNGFLCVITLWLALNCSVRVANELGAGRAKAAKFSIIIATSTSLIIGSVMFIVFLLLRGHLAYIFTDSLEVARAVADLSPLLAFSILLNSVQPVLSGVAIGAGWQSLVAYVNVTCYYLIGIPIGVALGYMIGFHVKGIWMGMILGTTCQTIVLICITWRTDWDKQVVISQQRVTKWAVPKTDDRNDGPRIT